MIGPCSKVCDNKNSMGWCQTTGCIKSNCTDTKYISEGPTTKMPRKIEPLENIEWAECCHNCKYKFDLEKWDYTKVNKGVPKTKENGFICSVLNKTEGGPLTWMYGLDEYVAHCEMFNIKDDIDPEWGMGNYA